MNNNEDLEDKRFSDVVIVNKNEEEKNKDAVVRFRAASEIISSPFLTFCRACGAPLVKKGSRLTDFDGMDHYRTCPALGWGKGRP